ncbi:MAG: NUDIX domain-containing protein [Desulfobacteraceae bacterium]|nr:MAG: NUDIX domain-containing protein [Desulfobacteraceae bacterium]
MTEFFEITDHLGKPTGSKKERGEAHRNGDWHRSSHLHLIHPDHRIIFQQRSDKKDIGPNLADVAVGGHLSPGESPEEAIRRETLEEIGIDINHYPGEWIPIPGYRVAIHEFPEKNIMDHELQKISFFLSDLRIEQLTLQREEIFAIMEFHIPDILDLFLGKKETIINSEGRYFDHNEHHAKLKPYIRAWTKNDFIPAADHYFGKAAFIAQSILRGQRIFPGI